MSRDRFGIRVNSVCKHYMTESGPVRAVDGITLQVEPGSSLAITGPSGCGKSTLLGLIAGLEAPTAGRVFIGESEMSALGEGERARLRREALGLVFQADNLLPFLSAVENVSHQLALHGASEGYERCLQLLEELGLADHMHKLPDQLSGGQRQRVAVARALIHEPSVILADEPTGSLDAGSSDVVIDLLLSAQDRIGATLVIVTHDLGAARRLNRRVGLSDGALIDGAGSASPTASVHSGV